MTEATPSAGWYADPYGAGMRYWDGQAWTRHVHPAPRPAKGAPPVKRRSPFVRVIVFIVGTLLLGSFGIGAVDAFRIWDGNLLVLAVDLLIPLAFGAAAYGCLKEAFKP